MSRSPNSEQLMAIQHQGGILLKAGAGSGKTFVLVEHIFHLTQNWIVEFKKSSNISFEEFIKGKFSQIVMMTFTKKAAGEMSIRLNERFLEYSKVSDHDQGYWKIVNDTLPALLVTTIDGFCRKLITMGYFPHLSTETDIIFDIHRVEQIRELVDKWFIEESQNISTEVLSVIVREKNEILSSFCQIFSDPGLRLLWKKFDIKNLHPDSIGKILNESFMINKLDDAVFKIHRLELDEEKKRSAFEKLVATFQNSGLPIVTDVDKFKIYSELFSLIKRLDGERTASKKTPESIAAKDGLSQLRTWVVKWNDVVKDYEQYYDTKVFPWMDFCLKIFHYIETRLDPNQGMTFGDIEYFCSLGLENKDDRERIQKNFKYFIIDEFQDTSEIQFKIIEALIGSDFNRLFCVGDAKQAIYGFRGGELSVFRNCENLVPLTLKLANNYRSLPNIIDFNNSLFKKILPLGFNFEGIDAFSVVAEDQHIPTEVDYSESGSVEIYESPLERELETEGKYTNEEINKLEAAVIADAILEEQKSSEKVCTVLYSKLRPSGELIRALIERKIGFTAQYKIDLLDDPVIGMFVTLLKRKFDVNLDSKNKYTLFIFKTYFKLLNLNEEINESDLEEFDLNIEYFGLIEAYRKFIHKLKMTNENSDINLDTLETVSELLKQDPESILTQIQNGNNNRLSLELRIGEKSHLVQIMSAHASKGLEFDVVYLAGIYTNGREQNDGGLFGGLPGSFQWYLDLAKREKQKSPFYVLENEINKCKNFSESKRLFYVACTRARRKLCWVNFDIPDKTFSIPKNSWILGLRTWLDSDHSPNKFSLIKLNDFDAKNLLDSKSLPELPLYFYDSVGVFPKGMQDTQLMIVPELSVTRITSLLQCPRKFYFSNVLKITAPDTVKHFMEDDEEETETIIHSSAKRGTDIHSLISHAIINGFNLSEKKIKDESRGPVTWVLELLKQKMNDYEFVSERPLKFKFFNYMVSGTPDLLLLPKADGIAQIWDFKTGQITQDNLEQYWFQLSMYGLALYEMGTVSSSEDIELVLSFVDEKKLLTRKIDQKKMREELFPIWRSQNLPWKVNLDHCSQCSYGSICPR